MTLDTFVNDNHLEMTRLLLGTSSSALYLQTYTDHMIICVDLEQLLDTKGHITQVLSLFHCEYLPHMEHVL